MRYVKIFIKKIFIALIYAYKWLISPILPKTCRFLPTCSDYALDAIEKHGILYGSYLTCKRLLRCHPFGGHGLDFVPNKIMRKRKKCRN